MTYNIQNLVYNGERDGVHNWESMSGMHYYWHPNWLHIAEDMTGHKAAATISTDGEKPTPEEAVATLKQHVNQQK
ncbi:hypothetical protein NFHSH190041_33340 [Shewanella sp. NFH-SH190041]|uniref:hypothetical protein n=1 Tax=Shewanella sp. NFH-SH190041 TaxID=2950245 RepID=UPI0021C342CB|nr:hypothetical protein [Shewanella sp. NFH-SH190041]BDM65882.1 hypothetical protein NFHSH190041_33340 [Shewanella sp. NFH-SH190041]